MKPLILKGHEKNLSCICYNTEGDLLFSAAKDKFPCVWYTFNGERLGTYNGHNGAVNRIDVTYDTKQMVSAAGDGIVILWDVETGLILNKFDTSSVANCASFSYSGNLFMSTNDSKMGKKCTIFVHDKRAMDDGPAHLVKVVDDFQLSDVRSGLWSYLDQDIVVGHVDGSLSRWDLRDLSKPAAHNQVHKDEVRDLKSSADGAFLASGSKDTTACLIDSRSLEVLKVYQTKKPVNAVALSPNRPHLVSGGGQEARDVTRTAHGEGGFEVHFFHLIYGDEFAQVKDHFGPVNCVEFHPNGNSYASGGEDGLIRLHDFDKDYLEFEML